MTIPEGSRVVITDGGGSSEAAPFGLIVVPVTSELIFADQAIVLHVHELRVHGKLSIGAVTCRITGPVRMVFHGAAADVLELVSGEGSAPAASQPLSVPGKPGKGLVFISKSKKTRGP